MDLSQKGGATQKRLGTTGVKSTLCTLVIILKYMDGPVESCVYLCQRDTGVVRPRLSEQLGAH